MDVSACPLLHHLQYMWQMCAGRRAESQLESCLYARTKVTRCLLCLCVMLARKWLWFSCKMQIKVELYVTCNHYAVAWLEGNIFKVWSWTFVAHYWVLMCEHTQVHVCDCERAAHATYLILNLHMLKLPSDLYVTSRQAEILCLMSPGMNKFRLCRQLWHFPSLVRSRRDAVKQKQKS